MQFSKILLPAFITLAAAAVIPSANQVGERAPVPSHEILPVREAKVNAQLAKRNDTTCFLWGGKGTTPVVIGSTPFVTRSESAELEPRQRSGAGIAIRYAVRLGVQLANELANWTSARREFTQAVTDNMWANNPDRGYFAAAICYNKGYGVRNRAGLSEIVSQKLNTGFLSTDYDCMYMSDNNAFWTAGDGGYENLAYAYDGSRCSFDGRTGDLNC